MKILYADKYFWEKGGAERVFFQERTAALEAGFQVVDFSTTDPRNFPSPYSAWFVPGTDYSDQGLGGAGGGLTAKARAAMEFVRNARAVKAVTTLAERERPQIAHLHNIYHHLTPSIIPALKKRGVKVVLTLHDCKLVCPSYLMLHQGRICDACRGRAFWHAAANRCPDGSWYKGMLLSLEAYWHRLAGSYQAVDLFIAPSRFMAELVSRYRVDRRKVAVVPNGVELDRFRPSDKDLGYALYIGRVSSEKGLVTLARAHALLAQRGPAAPGLKVVGEGPLKDELSAAHPGIEFCGYRSGEELSRLVEESAMVILPSECNENAPLAVLEGGASGKAVIGSDLAGIPELIEEGVTGLLFPPGNAEALADRMAELAADPGRRREMGLAGRRRVETNYDIKDHNRRILEIYQALNQGEAVGGGW